MRNLYRLALHLYPKDFRRRFGGELQQVYETGLRRALHPARFAVAAITDLLISSVLERMNTVTLSMLFRFAALPVLLVLSTTLMQAYVISGPSMEGTLKLGDHVLVNKLARTAHFGDLIAFRYPVDRSQTFVKRVIGLPGDRIRLENKQVLRNGRLLQEAYVEHRTGDFDGYRDNFPGQPTVSLPEQAQTMLSSSVQDGEIVVPAGMIFVLGDNRDVSLDSRFFGFVPEGDVIGHPWLVYWSRDERAHETRWDRMPLVLQP